MRVSFSNGGFWDGIEIENGAKFRTRRGTERKNVWCLKWSFYFSKPDQAP